MQEHTDELEKMILTYLREDQFRVLRLITEKFFIRYKAMLTSLFTGCLQWCFSFTSEDERRAMTQDLPSVEMMLRSMLLPPNLEEPHSEMGQINFSVNILHEETRKNVKGKRDNFTQTRYYSKYFFHL